MARNVNAINPKTALELMYCCVRESLARSPAVCLRSAKALPSPAVRLALILNSV